MMIKTKLVRKKFLKISFCQLKDIKNSFSLGFTFIYFFQPLPIKCHSSVSTSTVKITKIISTQFCFQSCVSEMNPEIKTSISCMWSSDPEHTPFRDLRNYGFLNQRPCGLPFPLLFTPFSVAGKCIV